MNILITGATGFIGQRLVRRLIAENHNLVLWVRNQEKAQSLFNDLKHQSLNIILDLDAVDLPIDAVINLAGEPIIDKRWTSERKVLLEDSRIGVTRELVGWLSHQTYKPSVFLSGSAIGIYGNYPENVELTEQSAFRDCYPSYLCQQWEFEAQKAQTFGVRVCLIRTGVVLHPDGGALKKMYLPFKLGVGGRVASGQQWLSWIHLEDMVRLLTFLLDSDISGSVNATAPEPVPYQIFTTALAQIISRPHLFPMPATVIKLMFGEAGQLLIEGQKVVPSKLLKEGFEFRYRNIDDTLRNFFSN